MSETFLNIFIFCVVLVFYLHIYRHSKISNDLEIFEMATETTSTKLNEVLEFLQPVFFKVPINFDLPLSNYGAFDINIRNANNYVDEIYLPLCFSDANILINTDSSQNYFSENNQEFLQETGLVKHLESFDELLKPSACCYSHYDILLGSISVSTPLRHHMNYRQFVCLLKGSITVKVCPPKNSKYLSPVYDYDNFEFRSLANPWNDQQSLLKVKFMDIELKSEGDILFIPPYWWNSIQIKSADTQVAVFTYRTCMNSIYVGPHYFLYLLQRHNIKNIIYHKQS